MKIAITGPNGFISKNIILHLEDKNEIILLSRKKLKFKNLRKKQIFKFDMSKNIIPKLSCDVLIHTAALTPTNKIFKNYHEINFLSLKKIIKNINIKKKIIFLSTSNIYRNQNKNFNLREN
jgi:nucleoside-diphosphate-sugar epimerase